MNKFVIGIILAVVLVAVGAGAFWGGTIVGQNRAQQTRSQFFQQRFGAANQGTPFPFASGTPEAGRARQLGGGTMGTIKSINGSVLTVETQEGDIQVQTTETTLVQKYMTVNVGDLQVGEQVVVSGARGEDGTITARSIQSVQGFQNPQSGQPGS